MSGFFAPGMDLPQLQTSQSMLDSLASSASPISMSAGGSSTSGSRFEASPISALFVPDGFMGSKNGRVRRKSTPGMDPVKHRRTRSGCFTCRTRRVKCDETHPICERCQKGGRECTYPDIPPIVKAAASKKREKAAHRDDSSSLEELDEEDEDMMTHDGEKLDGSISKAKGIGKTAKEKLRRGSSSTADRRGFKGRKAINFDHSPSPKPDGSMTTGSPDVTSPSGSLHRTASNASLMSTSYFGNLSHDLQFHINYHIQKITYQHYLLKSDFSDFFKTRLLDYARTNEALMYAVAAFASFHYSVANRTGIFHTFLELYNKAVQLLRPQLTQAYNVPVLLTILQLASFEEYLGDWASLMQHRNAATEILTHIYTPESMAETPEARIIYNWVSRFDLFAAMMAGHTTTLDRDWCNYNREFYRREAMMNPGDIVIQLEYALATLRDLAMDVSVLIARRTQGTLIPGEFLKEVEAIRSSCMRWWKDLDPALLENPETVPASPLGPEEEPFLPAVVYKGVRWVVNFMLLDYYGLLMLTSNQIGDMSTGGQADLQIAEQAMAACRVIAAIQTPDAPPSVLLPTQAALGLAALWLPPNPIYRMWIRKQLAKIEEQGYTFPRALRVAISELYGDPEISNQWIPTVSDNHSMGKLVRQLIELRESEKLPIQDRARDDVREMRALLADLKIEGSSSSVGSPETPTAPQIAGFQPHMTQIHNHPTTLEIQQSLNLDMAPPGFSGNLEHFAGMDENHMYMQ